MLRLKLKNFATVILGLEALTSLAVTDTSLHMALQMAVFGWLICANFTLFIEHSQFVFQGISDNKFLYQFIFQLLHLTQLLMFVTDFIVFVFVML